MKKHTFVLSLLAAGFITLPSFAARAGCCDGDTSATANCPMMSGHNMEAMQATSAVKDLPKPVATVFDNYIHIQTALAKDSIDGVKQNAEAISKTVKDDPATAFSTSVVQQAETVAKATDLPGARDAFKPLSQSLIEYISKYPALAGSYRQVHCTMVDASWLQTESMVNNPYLGASMLHCGQFVQAKASQDHSMHMH